MNCELSSRVPTTDTTVFPRQDLLTGLVATVAVLSTSCMGDGQTAAREPTRESIARLSGATGPMNLSRTLSAGAALSNGNVLMAGGFGPSAPTSTSEVYSATGGTWAFTGSMSVARYQHTATSLSTGEVLVAGGVSSTNLPSAAEIYNPSTGLWTLAGNLAVPRDQHAATLLADGRVMVAGGQNAAGATINSVEFFNRTTNTWSVGPSMIQTRIGHTLTRLANGSVLAVSGYFSNAEVWNPATNSWSLAGDLSTYRLAHSATLLPDGRVLVVGGRTSSTQLASAEIYDPTVGTWTLTGSLSVPRAGHAAFVDPSGGVIVLGGTNAAGPILGVERWDPATGTWSAIGTLIGGRSSFVSAALSATRILLAGGGTNSAEVYTVEPICVPTTCALQSATCGVVSNGCGGTLSCGTCGLQQVCSSSHMCVDQSPQYDPTRGALVCSPGPVCDSSALLVGRGPLGPEPNAPNTIGSGCADGTSGVLHSEESLDRLAVRSLDGGTLTSGQLVRIEAAVWARSDFSSDALDLYTAADATSPSWAFIATLIPTATGAQTLSSTYVLPEGQLQAIRGVFRYGGAAAPCSSGEFDDHDDLVFPVAPAPDITPPVTAITAPAAGASVSGTVQISASASDNVGVSSVDFLDGSTVLGTMTTPANGSPYVYSWNTLAGTNGVHSISVVARDAAGNTGTSASVSVTVNNISYGPMTAGYDPARRVPVCATAATSCDTGTLIDGRGTSEVNTPNTIGGSCGDGASGIYHSDESLDRLRISTVDGMTLTPGKTVRVDATVWAYSSYTSDHLDIFRAADALHPVWTLVSTLTPTLAGKNTLSATFVLPTGSLQAIRGVFRYGGTASACSPGVYNDYDDLVFATP